MDATPDIDRFASRRSTVYGTAGLVATSQPLAAEAGIEVLRSGGNAFDAAVAAAATLNVVEPTSTGLGGDVFALYRTADGTVSGLRSCGGAPEAATIDAVRERLPEDPDRPDDELPQTGPFAVTVPGTARGWEAIIDEHGTKPLGELLEPAIRYAREGYPVSEIVVEQWQGAETLFQTDHARAAYLVDSNRPPRVGEVVTLPDLGASLAAVAEEGADVVYEGWIALDVGHGGIRAGIRRSHFHHVWWCGSL